MLVPTIFHKPWDIWSFWKIVKTFFNLPFSSMFFLMKIIAMTIQITRTSQKLDTQNISPWKETLYKNLGLSVNPTALTLLSKVRPCTIILVQDRLFNLIIWKPTAKAFQNTLTFDRYLFNSMSNFHANLVHWNSLYPINAHFTYFF